MLFTGPLRSLRQSDCSHLCIRIMCLQLLKLVKYNRHSAMLSTGKSLTAHYTSAEQAKPRTDCCFLAVHEPDFLKIYRMLNIAQNIPYGESPFLLTFAMQSGSHGVVGYGLESGEWEYSGKAYDGRILVWDSNYPEALHAESCLYYDSQTFDYCIPQYGVHVAEGAADNTAGIITVCNDMDVLNACPYPFESHDQTGDINCDGTVDAADVKLLVKHLTVQTTLTDSRMHLADVSGDKQVNAIDLTLLKRII